jgi:hypothetical protein
MSASVVFADTTGPATGHTLSDVRVMETGTVAFKFTPALSAGCMTNDVGQVATTHPAFKVISSYALTAFTTARKVQLIYSGCTAGQVNVTGMILIP